MTQTQTMTPVHAAGTDLSVMKGGTGAPLLLLHGGGGSPGWTPYHQALSDRYTVYAPSHPGFDGSERPGWVSTITDTAHFYLSYLDQEGLDGVHLLGFSLGGWIAAEMAAMCPHAFRSLVLVDPAGIKPEVGEIAETMMISPPDVQKLLFHDTSQVPGYEEMANRELTPEEQAAQWSNREMLSRLGWRPYLHNPKLPDYLKRVKTPSLIIWGRQDAIIPMNSGELYAQALSNSRLHVIDNCGHAPQMEKPQEFLAAVTEFLSGV